MSHRVLDVWHQVIKNKDTDLLDGLLADNTRFISPIVFAPQAGKPLTKMYLRAASHVLSNDSFRYCRTMTDDNGAIMEFEVIVDGVAINGVDMIRWNEDNQITEFKVMLRPLQAINLVHEKMGAVLQRVKSNK